MYEKIIIDADLCIKLGGSEKYRFLVEVLPLVSEKIYMHKHAFGEVLVPQSAKNQLEELVKNGTVEIVSEDKLNTQEKAVYQMIYKTLANVMIDPNKPNKNKGKLVL